MTITASGAQGTAAVAAYWARYCAQSALPPATRYQAWCFGDSPQMAHELAELVLRGPKRATAGMAAWNERHPEDAPVPDGYSVVTEHDGAPRCVIRTTWLDRRPLDQVDAAFAWDEGEGDRTLPDWMAGHRRYFSRVCPTLGLAFADDMEVVLERFELLYPFDAALNPVDCAPRIVPGYLPGAVGTIAAQHALLHAQEYGFDARFEGDVAGGVAAFLGRFDPARDGLWLLVDGGRIAGSLALDGGGDQGARLRWFSIAGEYQGRGFGARMLAAALDFCRRAGHPRLVLATVADRDAAGRLYERAGFRRTGQADTEAYGGKVREQFWEWRP
jgi:uncharacterized protein YhfF/GNAT superfamily N-acetyltransferase